MTVRTTPRRASGIDTHPSGDELLVHDTRQGKIHVLNTTAAAIFALCDGEHDVGTIVASVADTWSADKTVVAADVAHMITTFRELALLEADDREEATRAAPA
jgi:Coenzyme PQQ synthesis protein D (PqqD)